MSHEDLRSLEEKLAEKFFRLMGKSERGDMRSWASVGHEVRNPFILMAKEALRVAEWARTGAVIPRCPNDCKGCPDCDTLGRSQPMSLPPDGWTPDITP